MALTLPTLGSSSGTGVTPTFPGSTPSAPGLGVSALASQQFEALSAAVAATQQQASTAADVPLSAQKNVLAAQNSVTRTAWIMSTTEWLSSSPQRGIVWAANPSDITWSMPQRSVHSKNLFGTVLHVWPDNGRDTFFDELRLTLNLQSSNIMPVQSSTNSVGWVESPGIVNFYDFMQLVDAPKLTSTGRANLVSIQYNSTLFPKLTLLGMFDSGGIRFTDSASNPLQVNAWSVDFIVYDTAPRLTSVSSGQQSNQTLLKNWLDQMITNNPNLTKTTVATG